MASRSSVHHPDTTEGLVQTLDPCTGRRGCLDTMETMKMSYELLKTITGNFSNDNVLGSGTFGVVYKGVLNGKEIAVKILRDMAALDDNAFRNEFQNLARLNHRNIVQLVGYCNESEKQTVERDDGTEVIAEKMHVALCFQYVENGSLHKHISDEYQGLHWHIRYKIIKGICEGLKHLRVGLESPVLHLDLKPENILLDKEMVPKIADFGLSRLIGEERTKQTINSVGTCGYWPPEYVKFQLLSEAFDIFSLGVIITKIMIGNEGYHSFADMLPRKLVKHVHNNWKKKLQETIEPTSLELEAYYCQQVKTCIKMASKCLSEDRKERPSIQEIVCALNEAEIMMRNIPLQIEKKVDRTYVMKSYPYELLRRITDNFSEERLLGEGGFGRVYKGIHEDGREIVVKVLRYFSAFDPEHFQAEVETVARFRHENIIQLAGYCYEKEQTILQHEGRLVIADSIHSAICFEYLQNGSIERHILDKSDGLDWCTCYKIIKGTCNGLRYLHEGLPYPIIHFDLKPSNILLDGNMVPKISDFALERVFGEDKMRTIMGFSSMRYLPPEFVTKQIVSKGFDIYSLGIIILEMMAGISAHSLSHDMISEEFIKFVLGKWRKRLEATLTGRRLLIVDIYCNQVKKCIEIALECVEADRQRRPSIGHVVNALDETENRIHEAESEWNDEDSRSSYTKNSSNRPYKTRNYSYKLLREITNDFSEDRLIGQGGSGSVYKGVNEDGREIAVKILHFNGFSGVDSEHFQNEVYTMGMIQHENIVRLVGYCDETEKLPVEHHGRVVFADKIHRALCFEYLQNGSLTKHISSDGYDGLDWCRLYKILKGICDGLRYLHEELPNGPILHLDLKPSHILLDENMVPKISGFTLSRCLQEGHTVVTSSIHGTLGYMPPEYIVQGIISAKSDIYSLGVTIIYMLTGRRRYTIEDEISSQEFMEDVFKNWRRRLQESLKGRSLEGYCQQVKKCIEIASQCVEGDRHKRPNIGAIVRMLDETETMIMVHDAGKLLDVHPMELRFPLKPKRFASSLLRLRNKEDHHVAFRLVSKGQKMYHTNLPLLGIVPPKCTYTIALRMCNQQKRPQLDGDEGLLVQSVAVSRQQCLDQASVVREFQSHFNKAQESDDDEVQEQEVTLEFVSSPPTEEASSKIITAPDAQEVSSIEVHPKEPWIMTTHERGNFRIWNYQTLAILNPIRLPEESVYVAKFIAREEWIVAGDGNGCIHVFGYDEYQDTTSFEAHNGQIMSLAVHPKNSYVLSSSHEDHLIKLWHWDKYWDFEKGPWVCTRTFEGHSNKVSHVIFNPDGTDSFASASWDGTVKIWDWGLNSDVCNTITLDAHPDGLLCIDYITGADPQHLITGSKDQTAQIWDLKIKRCREFLQGHAHHVSVVYCHQELHKLFTGSLDGTVRIWDSMTYRLENIIALNLGAVSDVGYIDELQRIVVGCHKGIAMMEIKFDDLSASSEG